MYKVTDLVYANRWATMPDGYIVKFDKQIANVPDKYIRFFRKDGYIVGVQTSEVPPVAVTTTVEKKVVKKE